MPIFTRVQAELGSEVLTLLPGDLLETKINAFYKTFEESAGAKVLCNISVCANDGSISLTGSWKDLACIRQLLKKIYSSCDSTVKSEKHVACDPPFAPSSEEESEEESYNSNEEPSECSMEELSEDEIGIRDSCAKTPMNPHRKVTQPSMESYSTGSIPSKTHSVEQLKAAESMDATSIEHKQMNSEIPMKTEICVTGLDPDTLGDTDPSDLSACGSVSRRKRRKSKFPAKLSYFPDDENDSGDELALTPPDRNTADSYHPGDDIIYENYSTRRKRGRPRNPRPKYNEEMLGDENGEIKVKKKRGRPRIYPPGYRKPKKSYPPKYEECTCPECDFTTTNRKNLAEHIKGNHQEKIHSCPICDKKFSTRNRLNMHVKYHTSRGTFQCEVCGRNLSSKTALDIHTHKKHDGPRPKCLPKEILCTLCGKLCINSSEYEVHMNKEHNRVTPYVCDLCGKCYHGKVGLQSHQREVHNTDYKIQCSTCGKMFKRKNNLDAHKVSRNENLNIYIYICIYIYGYIFMDFVILLGNPC